MKVRCRRREITIGDIDGDALFALGLQPVDQQREIDSSPLVPCLRESRYQAASWSSKISLLIMEQTPDQRRFAVVDRTAGQESQQVVSDGVAMPRVMRARRLVRFGLRLIRSSPRASSSPSMAFVAVDQRAPGVRKLVAVRISATICGERRGVGLDGAGERVAAERPEAHATQSAAPRPARAASARRRP